MLYFSNFPKIEYSNTVTVDITKRVKVVDNSKKSPYAFYPYDITFHLRSDQVAEYYYENSRLDWLIYLSNEIVDPYYDWYVRDDQLDELIRTKYGSTETAKRKVKYYMNNWHENSDDSISVDYYENNLDKTLKKYWDPHFSENGKVMYYKRRRVDHTMNTNMVIDFDITSFTSGNSFVSGELVKVWQPGTQVGAAEAVFSNSTVVRVQSVFGDMTANTLTGTYIVGETSKCNVSVDASNTVIQNISLEEGAYWSPVYFYDHEVMKNEENKTIRLVDEGIVPFLLNDFREKIAE